MINCHLTSMENWKCWEQKMEGKRKRMMERKNVIYDPSSWCAPCIRLETTILALTTFKLNFHLFLTRTLMEVQVENRISPSPFTLPLWQGIKICWLKIQFRLLSSSLLSTSAKPGKEKVCEKISHRKKIVFQRRWWRMKTWNGNTCYDGVERVPTWKLNKTRWELYQQFSSRDWHHLEQVKRHRIDPMCADVCVLCASPSSIFRLLGTFQLLLNYFYSIFYEHRWGGEDGSGDDDFMFTALWCLFCATIRHYSWCH